MVDQEDYELPLLVFELELPLAKLYSQGHNIQIMLNALGIT